MDQNFAKSEGQPLPAQHHFQAANFGPTAAFRKASKLLPV